ncbi:MAG: ribonuclease HII [Microbacteriaceae bacterium]|nr:ribonuclease HII [Microbacteriaceae bacterium]
MSDTPAPQARESLSKEPTLQFEHDRFADGVTLVIGVDEVGRGAIAGPVAVGVHAVTHGTLEFPLGLRDSKLLSEKKREAIAPLVTEWGAGAVGFSTPQEIDERGISWALGEAGRRALLDLHRQGVPVSDALILVDGSHDWLSPSLRQPLRVQTKTQADRTCASVAAASVRAKVERDDLMRAAHEAEPHYGWLSNKGYGSKAHYAGIEEVGLSPLHRRSWIRMTGER